MQRVVQKDTLSIYRSFILDFSVESEMNKRLWESGGGRWLLCKKKLHLIEMKLLEYTLRDSNPGPTD